MKIIFIILFFASFGLKSSHANFEPDPNAIFPLVTMPLGTLRGVSGLSRAGKLYYSYKGIPYAQPPERFQPAVLVEPWEGIRDARENGAVCAQMNIFTGQFDGSENCLFLNIDFPHEERCQNESENGNLPVMFHIHGGSFSASAGSEFGGQYLLDECVVYVSINYRLGALGFLTTGDDVIPGNLGLKDAILALKWTQKYITHFRGDPSLVTIMGISSGGFAVSLLVTSPAAEGLFARAISQSGTTISQWSIQRNALSHANALGVKLNCPTETSVDLKSCLEGKTVEEIIKNQADGKPIPFGPVIEPLTAVAPFQTENPASVLTNGNFNRVPLIAGFMEDEGITLLAAMVLMNPNKTTELNDKWQEVAPEYFCYHDLNLSDEEKNRISTEIRKFYFGDQQIGEQTRQNLVNLYSDRNLVQGTFKTVELHSKYAPAYGYVVTYKGGFSGTSTLGYEVPRAGHGDDVQYIYVAWPQIFKQFTFGSEQFQFSRQLVTHFTTFAKTGAPHSSFGDDWSPTDPSKAGNSNWHNLQLPEKSLPNYLEERRLFWENLGLLQHEMTLTP